ncbi:TPA: tRNA uridine(34) 5-carboxymethylaminomethyl modification radical SAM/GNAT enzyme Elp3, partial [Candidatus Magasanikbacteria bacterium]|nr:tRNA uridine(34) 5-carboxymethylaminomethyl modification radical SAM/GNAT enzyme Elp3 [Candidatus Magasanikbacteria bacterium]
SLFTDEGLKPDMVKIYPCTVIKSAELYSWFESGKYKPYASQDLFKAILEMKKLTPYYCRISRLIRDIPSNEIEGGNAITNLREALEKELHKQGEYCKCLRCREVGHAEKIHKIKADKLIPQLFVEEFQTRGGREFFLSLEDEKRRVVFAFLRLRLPEYNDKIKKSEILEKYLGLGDLKKLAYVRELHTYGQLVNVGDKNSSASQHKGMGTKLVKEADKIARENGYTKIAVISGVGVRSYYRKFGYKKIGTYMAKNLK